MKEERQADRKSKQKIASILVLMWSIQCVSGQPRSFFPTKKEEEEKKKKQRARKDGKSKKRIQGYSIYKDAVTKSGVRPMDRVVGPMPASRSHF